MRHFAIVLATFTVFAISVAVATDAHSDGDVATNSQKLTFTKDIPNFLWGWLVELYNKDYVEAYDRNMDWLNPPFSIAQFDVDLDKAQKLNSNEVFVKWDASIECGSGGCTMFLLRFDGNKWGNIGNFFPAGDVEIDRGTSHGMPVIWVSNRRYRWNGQKYVE